MLNDWAGKKKATLQWENTSRVESKARHRDRYCSHREEGKGGCSNHVLLLLLFREAITKLCSASSHPYRIQQHLITTHYPLPPYGERKENIFCFLTSKLLGPKLIRFCGRAINRALLIQFMTVYSSLLLPFCAT